MYQFFDIFFAFTRVGALTFGGGYAMMPILQREIADKRGWATEEELTDYYALSQCMPGVIAANTATFIGEKQGGLAGGVAAALGISFPSLVIITIIAAFLQNFIDIPLVQDAFAGVSVCVCVLIFYAVVRLWKSTMDGRGALAIFAAVFGGSLALNLLGRDASPVIMVLLSGLAGIVLGVLGRRADAKKGGK